MFQIQALVESRSPLAIPTLTKLLSDKDHPDHIANAADGLGLMGAKTAIPALRQIYQDGTNTLAVRLAAAAGLYRMNDTTGLPLLQKQLALPDAPFVQLGTARFMAPQPGGPPPDPTWLKVVRQLAASPNTSVRAQAAGLVAPYDNELARKALEPLLTDGDTVVREMAAKTMIESVATDFTTLRYMLRSASALTRVRAADRVLKLTR